MSGLGSRLLVSMVYFEPEGTLLEMEKKMEGSVTLFRA